jgi:hypothetical protein
MQLSQTYILDRRAALTGHAFPRVSDFGEKKSFLGKPPYTQPYKEMQGSYSGIEHLQLK